MSDYSNYTPFSDPGNWANFHPNEIPKDTKFMIENGEMKVAPDSLLSRVGKAVSGTKLYTRNEVIQNEKKIMRKVTNKSDDIGTLMKNAYNAKVEENWQKNRVTSERSDYSYREEIREGTVERGVLQGYGSEKVYDKDKIFSRFDPYIYLQKQNQGHFVGGVLNGKGYAYDKGQYDSTGMEKQYTGRFENGKLVEGTGIYGGKTRTGRFDNEGLLSWGMVTYDKDVDEIPAGTKLYQSLNSENRVFIPKDSKPTLLYENGFNEGKTVFKVVDDKLIEIPEGQGKQTFIESGTTSDGQKYDSYTIEGEFKDGKITHEIKQYFYLGEKITA